MALDDVCFLIAQVDFTVGLGGSGSHVSVAVSAVPETSVTSAVAETESWPGVAYELEKNTVRLLAGEFKGIASKAICSLSTLVQVTPCGVAGSRWPSILILGPVSKVKMYPPTRGGGKWTGPATHVPKEVDQSRGWPLIEQVKHKPPISVLPHTTKFGLVVEGKESRRQPYAIDARKQARSERANASPNATWAKPFTR